ncbi:hypothetical protein HELRODRAFT_94328 [Helobdella robusta]|uniref:Protein kinase domain-containing protein n=1 Tax=Helobdella robusta TaxID=6412 RepID=T1G900_HELRO|nr:hypothetical protein HELRODRAFT_94328 [Helobdella robusta]ESO01971.1 hypothetical protein HELRODRAFT_94328 [Helobdella robusta]
MGISNFEFIRTIGSGSICTVKVAKCKTNGGIFAVKTINKYNVLKANQVAQVFLEKRILRSMNFPFIINIIHHFHDTRNLYMVMPFCSGGDLFGLLQRKHEISEADTKFYAAQIALALDFLHGLNIIYRDLKLENILLDSFGYVKLADFGLAKRTLDQTYTICGTIDYFAPEMLRKKGYNKAIDWWAFGVMIFEMVAGYVPFHAFTKTETYQRILSGQFYTPSTFSKDLINLIRNLLKTDPKFRLGNTNNGINDITNHLWFGSINWTDIFEKRVESPFKPEVKDETDTSYFAHVNETEEPKTILSTSKFADF